MRGCFITAILWLFLPANLAQGTEPGRSAFGDGDLFQGQTVLQLGRLIAEVERRNPTLAAKDSAWRAAAARPPQVRSLEDPVLSYGVAPATLGSSEFDPGLRVELSQRFPWPGKLRLRGEVAVNEAEAAEEDVEATRHELVQQAKAAYYDYYFVFRAIEINETNKSLLEEFRRIAETRYAVGIASKQDALQAEVEHDHLAHNEFVLERIRRTVQSRINTLLNRAPQLPLPPPPRALEPPGVRPDLGSLQDLALAERPELNAMVARLGSREAAVALARREFKPDFVLFGIYNSLWTASELRPLVGAGVNIPIHRKRRRAQLAEAEAELQRLQAELAERTAGVLMEVQEAYEWLVESEHVVRLYATRLVPAARENLEAARSGYRSGSNDFLTLVAAEKNLMNTQLGYQEALAAYHRSLADLERAVGGPLQAIAERTAGGR